MYQHALIIHSAYSEGKRIALHKYCETFEEVKKFMSLISVLRDKFKHLSFAVHHIQTHSDSIESIAEYDSFFNGIEYYSSFEAFVETIEQDITPKAGDIAKLILSRGEFSHLELQKLIYFSYCEYYKLYKEDMFLEDFEAWRHGPVIPDIYHSLKTYGFKKITKYLYDDIYPKLYSRLIKIPKYDRIVNAIDRTIEKYRDTSAWGLVDETHVPGGPWHIIYKDGEAQNQIIPKDLIKSYILENESILD